MRTLIFAQYASGTRFITRSIARTARCGFLVAGPAKVRPESDWVVGTHEEYTEAIAKQAADHGVHVLGTDRNVLDHLLSITKRTAVYDDLLVFAGSDQFHAARASMLLVPEELRVSYDLLADPTHPEHETECNRLTTLSGLSTPVMLEDVAVTMRGDLYVGQPGYWKSIFTDKQAAALCKAANEPIPE